MNRTLSIAGVLMVAVFSLCLSGLFAGKTMAAELPKVLTIYFAGTGLTEGWATDPYDELCDKGFWKQNEPFPGGEVVSTLYKNQLDDTETQGKIFVDGIGTGADNCLGNLFVQGLPSIPGFRGWDKVLAEALIGFIDNLYYLDPSGYSVQHKYMTLNLVGFSRGAVSTLMFADFLDKKLSELVPALYLKINILVFDPVPGERTLYDTCILYNSEFPFNCEYKPEEIWSLQTNVQRYVGIYSNDERSTAFDTILPHYGTYWTKAWMFRVPGSHETMVGNIQKDGHAGKSTFEDHELEGDENFDLNLEKVRDVTTYLAAKLLMSSTWGGVEFDTDFKNDIDEKDLKNLAPAMWDYDYSGMREHSFTYMLDDWWTYGTQSSLKYYKDTNLRNAWNCTSKDGDECIEVGLESAKKIEKLDNGEVALARLREMGNSYPVADIKGEYVGNEGGKVIFDASASSDPDGDALEYRWDLDGDGTWDTEWSSSPTVTYTWGDNYQGSVSVQVRDGEFTDEDTSIVTVNNVAPNASLDSMVMPNSNFILPIHTLTFNGSFTDRGWLDTHTFNWNFGDGVNVSGTFVEENNEPDATGSTMATHAYGLPGPYTATLTVADDDGASDVATHGLTVLSASQANQVLMAYVEGCPDSDFKKNPTERRIALLDKLAKVTEKIEVGDYQGAIRKLKRDIEVKADGTMGGEPKGDWIKDASTQSSICQMIDDLVAYLRVLKAQ